MWVGGFLGHILYCGAQLLCLLQLLHSNWMGLGGLLLVVLPDMAMGHAGPPLRTGLPRAGNVAGAVRLELLLAFAGRDLDLPVRVREIQAHPTNHFARPDPWVGGEVRDTRIQSGVNDCSSKSWGWTA